MAITRRRKIIGGSDSGIALTVLTDKKLKTSSFLIHFISPLTEENAAANSAAAFMLENSCSSYPTITSFSRRLAELYGASIRSGVSRFEDSCAVTLSGSCISDRYALQGEEISFELAELMTDCIFDPVTENGVFPEKEFALKKQELIDDIEADINDKRTYALKNAGRIIFRNEPSGIAVKGEKPAAMKLSSADAYDAYKKLIESARIEIIYVGSGLSEKCEKMLEDKFIKASRKNVYIPVSSPSAIKEQPEYVTERLDVVQNKMVMAYKTEKQSDEVMRVFNAVFGGTAFSLLFKNVREKLSLCYYCSSSMNLKKQVIYVDSGVEDENTIPAQEEIQRQLALCASGDFTDELLEQSKLTLKCALKAVDDSPRSVADWYFRRCMENEEDIITPEEFIGKIEAVTKQQVADLAASLRLDTVYVLAGKEKHE